MNLAFFRWSFIAVLLSLLIVSAFIEPTHLGVSAEWSNDGYHFAGGTALWALGYSLVIAMLYLGLLFAPSSHSGMSLPGVVRRFGAFFLDFIFVMMILGPVLGWIPVLAEWHRTGIFELNFDRTTPQPGDGIIVTATLAITFAGLLTYYAWPLLRGKPSPGSCVAGYQVITDDEIVITQGKAVLRCLLGFIALSLWPISYFVSRDRKRGKIWPDVISKTRAVKLS